MKNLDLKQIGVQELSTVETQSIEGGNWIVRLIRDGFIWDGLKWIASNAGGNAGGNYSSGHYQQ